MTDPQVDSRLADLPDAPAPYRLSLVGAQGTSLPRLLHGMTTARSRLRLLRRMAEVGLEVAAALPRDLLLRARPDLLRQAVGRPPRSAGSVALYVHYAATGEVSAMVLRQVEVLAQAGFDVVFVTMAPAIGTAHWQALRDRCAWVIQRRNCGYDFGAWKQLFGQILARWPGLTELLLANDSVLGPLRGLDPVFATLRAGGEGVFGLTESRQGGAHLQSYFLLLRGRAVFADFAAFLAQLRVSHSKWLSVQRGELEFTRFMRQRGHLVAALFGYERVLAAVLAQPSARAGLAACHPALRQLEALGPEARLALLHRQPLNPTHHLWLPLVRLFGFPFIKTDLVRRNPAQLPGVEAWPSLVAPGAPCDQALLAAHLAIMERPTAAA